MLGDGTRTAAKRLSQLGNHPRLPKCHVGQNWPAYDVIEREHDIADGKRRQVFGCAGSESTLHKQIVSGARLVDIAVRAPPVMHEASTTLYEASRSLYHASRSRYKHSRGVYQ